MLVQNAAFVLVMRYSRKQQGHSNTEQYNPAIVVTLQEVFKVVICFAVLAMTGGPSGLAVLAQPEELRRIAIPAICFTLQNNILYVALSNLDPLLFQITYVAHWCWPQCRNYRPPPARHDGLVFD